jgi:hypothetical protein
VEQIAARQIHTKMPPDLHKELRVQAAVAGVTIQEFVLRAIRAAIAQAKEGGKDDSRRR